MKLLITVVIALMAVTLLYTQIIKPVKDTIEHRTHELNRALEQAK